MLRLFGKVSLYVTNQCAMYKQSILSNIAICLHATHHSAFTRLPTIGSPYTTVLLNLFKFLRRVLALTMSKVCSLYSHSHPLA